MTLSFLARIISDAQDAQQEMEMYRSERGRSLELNHRFEEIVKEQDQKLAEQRKREERQQGEARQILTRYYGYKPEQLNGNDPVDLLYRLQPRAAASYREQFQRGSGKSVGATVALGDEVSRLSGEVRRLGEQVQELREYKRHAEPILARWDRERTNAMNYLRTTAGKDEQGEYYIRGNDLEGAVIQFIGLSQARPRQPPPLPPAEKVVENPLPAPEEEKRSSLEIPSPPNQTSPLPPRKRPPLWGARHGLKRE